MDKTMEMKKAFFCNNNIPGQEIQNLKKLGNLISKDLGIPIEITPTNELGNSVMYVPREEYHRCLEVGIAFAVSYGLHVDWINIQDEARPRDYISVMRGFLPETQYLDSHAIEIEDYRYHLQRYLGGKNVAFMYNKQKNSVDFLVKEKFDSTQEEFDLLRKQCQGFNYTADEIPFVNMLFLEKDGTLVIDIYNDITSSPSSKGKNDTKLLEKKW